MPTPLTSRLSKLALLPALLLGALAFAQPAAADDYCLPGSSCTANVGSLDEALGKADDNANADRIFLAPITYTAPTSGFNYQGGPVELIGAGAGTVIAGPYQGTDKALRLIGGPGTTVRDLTVRIPALASDGYRGLVTNGVARGVRVEDDVSLGSRFGVVLTDGGELVDSIVSLDDASETTGLVFDTGGGVVRDSAVSGETGVESRYGGTIERGRVRASKAGVLAERNTLLIRSSLVRVTAQLSTGIIAAVQTGSSNLDVQLDGVNVDGPPSGVSTTGVFATDLYNNTHSVNVTIRNSIIRRFDQPITATGFGGSGTIHIAASYSDYDQAHAAATAPNATLNQSHISYVSDSNFVNAGSGFYAPVPGSPLIDAGDPASAQGLDLGRQTLVVDGNHDGIARRDVGAYELQVAPPAPPAGGGDPAPGAGGGSTPPPPPPAGGGPAADTQAPLVSGFRSTRKSFAVGKARTAITATVRGTRFRYALSENAKVTIRILRRNGRAAGKLVRSGKKGVNTLKFSGRIGRKALKRGRYVAVLTATDAAGNRSVARRARFRVL